MNNRYNLTYSIVLSIIMLLAGTIPATAAESKDIEERVLPAAGITSFEAESIEGSFKVVSHGNDEVQLTITRVVKGVSQEQAEKVLAALKTVFKAEGDSIYLQEDHPGNRKEWKEATGLNDVEFEILYELRMPASIHQAIRTVEGDVMLAKMSGKIGITTVEGDVLVEQAGGQVGVKTTEGDVLIKQVAGFARVSSVEGDVMIRDSSGFQVQSVEGDVLVDLSGEPAGNCSLNTVQGDATLSLSPDLAVNIVAQSLSGEVKLKLSLDDLVRTRGQVVGARNGGGVSIQLNSVRGDIILK